MLWQVAAGLEYGGVFPIQARDSATRAAVHPCRTHGKARGLLPGPGGADDVQCDGLHVSRLLFSFFQDNNRLMVAMPSVSMRLSQLSCQKSASEWNIT